MPPTERSGRVHTSTVTVAAISPSNISGSSIVRSGDITWKATRGSGAGGQHRNKTSSAVIATHEPSGLRVRVESQRSQHQNRALAISLLEHRLQVRESEKSRQQANDTRKSNIGSGQRGDKIRTYRVKNNMVTDHRTGNKQQLSKWKLGIWVL